MACSLFFSHNVKLSSSHPRHIAEKQIKNDNTITQPQYIIISAEPVSSVLSDTTDTWNTVRRIR